MLAYGLGLNIIVIHLVQLLKSYRDCKAGIALFWEYGSDIRIKDRKARRVIGVVSANAAAVVLLFLLALVEALPIERGSISAEQFCRNYNYLLSYYDYEGERRYVKDGKIGMKEDDEVVMRVAEKEPEYTYKENGGVLTEVGFSMDIKGSDKLISSYTNNMVLCMRSFIEAQKGIGLWDKEVEKAVAKAEKYGFRNFEMEAHGVAVSCRVEYSGYDMAGEDDILFPKEGEETRFKLSFLMKKE